MLEEIGKMDSTEQSKWEFAKFKIREISRTLSTKKAKERRTNKRELLWRIDNLDPLQQSEEIAKSQIELDRILAQELDTIRMLAGVKHIEEGEKCTAFFFACIKKRKGQANIKCLKIDGQEVHDEDAVGRKIMAFYQDLYAARKRDKRKDWYARVPSLSQEQRDKINGPLSRRALEFSSGR